MRNTFLLLCTLVPTGAFALYPMPDANLRAWANSQFPGCIVGTNIDETHPGVVAATDIQIVGGNIQDLTGLSVFANATSIYCVDNPLGQVDELPFQATSFYFGNCQLTSFQAPPSATYINVRDNLLTSLDVAWCYQLNQLVCRNNQITSLTGMLGVYYTLWSIDASNNQLTAIDPYVPWVCSYLDISNNQFTEIPQLNPNMGHTVIAHHNLLTDFYGIPGNYNGLVDVSYNLIDSVHYIGTVSLGALDLSGNPLAHMVDLPVELQVLHINNTPLPCLPYLNKDLVELYCSGNAFTCIPNQPANLLMSQANFGFPPAVCTDADPCYMAPPSIAMKVFLQGPFDFQTYVMDDDLRAQNLIPSAEPYTALGFTYSGTGWTDTFDPAVLTVTGPDAVVDWVVVDMYPDPVSSFQGNAERYSRPAFVQRDGDVVGLDGSWPLSLKMNQGKYAAAVRHRNHLGAIERYGEWFADTTMAVDFTDWVTTICFAGALHGDSISDQNRQLWSGNVTFNNQLKYVNVGNDRDPILQAIGGVNPLLTVNGVYHNADVNMDGVIKYTGANNDRDPILQNIGGGTPLATRQQQGFL